MSVYVDIFKRGTNNARVVYVNDGTYAGQHYKLATTNIKKCRKLIKTS